MRDGFHTCDRWRCAAYTRLIGWRCRVARHFRLMPKMGDQGKSLVPPYVSGGVSLTGAQLFTTARVARSLFIYLSIFSFYNLFTIAHA
jgi:hypothetical protein